MHFPYKQFYLTGINIFLPISIGLGLTTGIDMCCKTSDTDVFCNFRNILTYTTIGLITGIAFPVTIPLIVTYTLYKQYVVSMICDKP